MCNFLKITFPYLDTLRDSSRLQREAYFRQIPLWDDVSPGFFGVDDVPTMGHDGAATSSSSSVVRIGDVWCYTLTPLRLRGSPAPLRLGRLELLLRLGCLEVVLRLGRLEPLVLQACFFVNVNTPWIFCLGVSQSILST